MSGGLSSVFCPPPQQQVRPRGDLKVPSTACCCVRAPFEKYPIKEGEISSMSPVDLSVGIKAVREKICSVITSQCGDGGGREVIIPPIAEAMTPYYRHNLSNKTSTLALVVFKIKAVKRGKGLLTAATCLDAFASHSLTFSPLSFPVVHHFCIVLELPFAPAASSRCCVRCFCCLCPRDTSSGCSALGRPRPFCRPTPQQRWKGNEKWVMLLRQHQKDGASMWVLASKRLWTVSQCCLIVKL